MPAKRSNCNLVEVGRLWAILSVVGLMESAAALAPVAS